MKINDSDHSCFKLIQNKKTASDLMLGSFFINTASRPIGTEAPKMFQNEKSADKPDFADFLLHSFTTLDHIKKWDESDNLKSAEKPYIIEVGEVERTINLCVAIPVKFEYEA